MELFLDIFGKQLIQNFTSTQVLGPGQPIFYSNDIPDINLQLIRPNSASVSSIPWMIYNPNTEISQLTMSLTIGFPISGQSSYTVDQQTMTFDATSLFFSGSLNLTGSQTQNLILGGSASYLEFQESGFDQNNGSPVIITWLQKDCVILPNV